MTRQRMVELLEIEKECVRRNSCGECNRACHICDLLQDDTELHEMYEEVIALVKAQEPRVLTWEEAQANMQDGPFIIFEVRDSTGSEVDFGVLAGDFYEMSEGSVLTVADFWMLKDEYGKQFRLWTSIPTDEQREATIWNE